MRFRSNNYRRILYPILAAVVLVSWLVPAMTARSAGSYDYYKLITIDADEVDANLTDYPLTLVISSDNDLRTTANSGHIENTASGGASGSVTVPADLVFGSSSDCSTQYDHEVEDYDATTGELVAHIRIPSLSGSTDTDVYMCYGDSGTTTSQEDVTGVWDSNYVGVWHMGEGGGTAYDSTSNRLMMPATTLVQQELTVRLGVDKSLMALMIITSVDDSLNIS